MDVSILDEQQQDDGDQGFNKNKTVLLAGIARPSQSVTVNWC